MWICTYIYTLYVYIYIYINVCLYIYMYIRVYIERCIYASGDCVPDLESQVKDVLVSLKPGRPLRLDTDAYVINRLRWAWS